MSNTQIQTSFHAGEWAPPLNARVDLAKYKAALALAENFFVDYRGGVSTRTGTKYIIQAYDSGSPVRLIAFQASQQVSYVLEFGHLYIRFINNGAPVLLTALNITAITNAVGAVVTIGAHSIALGNWVYIAGVLGMTEINARYFKVIAISATTITLGDITTAAPIDSTTWGVYTSGGTVSEQYLIPTTYTGSQLALLKFTQNVDSMIICHPSYTPKELTLVSATNWTLTDIVFGPSIGPPTVTVTPVNLPGSATGVFYGYKVSAVNADGEESVPSAASITSQIADMRTTAGSNLLGWGGVSGATSYNVYKADQGHDAVPTGAAYGFIGNTTSGSFLDTNIAPDFSISPPISNNPFSTYNPFVPVFFQQRLGLLGIVVDPAQVNFSIPGEPYNFNYSNPIQLDDGITQRLVAQQLNTIRSAVPVPTGLIVLTDKATWLVNAGESNSPITPVNMVANLHSTNGVSHVPPLLVGYDILMVQAKGSIVRNLSYKFEPNVFTGTDISVLSSHLFSGYQILEWCWAEEPYKLIYAVRSDGQMLMLTFLKEQELIGWCHSKTGPNTATDGNFNSVCSVVETADFGDVDAVYTVVQRNVGGSFVQYIERFAERITARQSAEDAWCVDSGLSYDGAPATVFGGLWHLIGIEVVGLADGVPVGPFTVDANGQITLAAAASKVIIGIAFTCDFQTLRLDVSSSETVQGKPKKIAAETVRVSQTLGPQIGTTFDTLVDMQDLIDGNLNQQDNTVVNGLYTGDARTQLDPNWTTQGQVCIRQSLPLPATILGVIPEFEVADG